MREQFPGETAFEDRDGRFRYKGTIAAAARGVFHRDEGPRPRGIVPRAGDGPSVGIPPQALKLLGQTLGAMSEGHAVTIMPVKREVSTVEAANFLNVSRPFVIKEIEAGRLPHRMVGTYRRIAFEDLHAYSERMRERQHSALRRLADADRELALSC